MTARTLLIGLLMVSAPTLGGCVAAMAASAASMAVRGTQKAPQSNEHLQPAARAECTARASQSGAVHIIDVQQATPSKIIVWGTVGEGAARRSFQCHYGTKITSFKLRAITATR